MRYHSAFPIIYTTDVQRALAFYRGHLGFRETFRFPAEGTPEFVSLALDDSTGVALGSAASPSFHGLDVEPGARGFEMCVYTDDVDTAVAGLREAGYEVLYEPADQPWKERMAYVADPDGNPVMICARHS